ncbi:MAG: branched-chain amino acid ABC transporter permease [Alphaproteobacteria bacterium]|nr:MAG: branched-chain amino acid ABC transporter permease [Alphaproteobacteria bacterium]
MIFLELFINALIAGILLGGFFAAISIGLSICFGLLDTVNLAHPTFVVAGAFCTFVLNDRLGIDPILAGIIITPFFFALGWVIYSAYYQFFERTSAVALRGLAFFFGLLFITEVVLIMVFGVDHRLVNAPYIGKSFSGVVAGIEFAVPYRLLSAFVVAGILTLGLQAFLDRSYFGRATRAVHQDMMALSLMGVDPVMVKRIAFGIGLGTCGIAGALMIIVIPIEPAVGRLFIGNVFAIVVLGGLGSISGTLVAAMILGIAESLVATFFGPSWAPAVSFSILLGVLAFRPTGLFGVGDTR